jgi:hypothetical protein
MRIIINILSFTTIVLLLSSCFAIQRGDEFSHIAPGVWRGIFIFGDDSLADKVPVNFEVLNTDKGKDFKIEFINGKTRVKADSIRFWGDTLYAWFDGHKRYLRLICEPGLVEGYLYDAANKDYPIEFYAQFGQQHRFLDLRLPPKFNVNGVWAMDILDESENIIPARLDLNVSKNKVTALLKTEKDSLPTELEGTLQNDKMFLSAFNGNKVILIKTDLRDSVTMGRGSIRFNGKSLACSAKKMK